MDHRPPYKLSAPDEDGWIDVNGGAFKIRIYQGKNGRMEISDLYIQHPVVTGSLLHAISIARLEATIQRPLTHLQ